MRYRQLDSGGDYSFGHSQANFLIDSPEAVGQAVLTRLQLSQGEWFLELTEGTPYDSQILGTGKQTTYDAAIKARILDTPGVTQIKAYASYYDPVTRHISVVASIDTQYGTTTILSA